MLLFNMFSNRFDDLVNISDEEHIISHHQTRNAMSFWLLAIEKNRVIGYFEIEKKALRRNRVASNSKIKNEAIKKNDIAGYSKRGEEIEDVNKNMSEVSFFNRGIIKYNWQKDKTLNPQVDKKKYLLARKIPRHISSDNQDPTWFLRPQQKIVVMRPNNPDIKFNSTSANIIAIKDSPDISAQLMLFCTTYTNYNHNLLASIKKPVIT